MHKKLNTSELSVKVLDSNTRKYITGAILEILDQNKD